MKMSQAGTLKLLWGVSQDAFLINVTPACVLRGRGNRQMFRDSRAGGL